MQEGVPGQADIDHGRVGADGPEPNPSERKIWRIPHEESHTFTGLDTVGEEELGILMHTVKGLAPADGTSPGPNAFFVAFLLGLGLEEVVN